MKHSILLAAAGLALSFTATAQNPLGTFSNTGTTWATRGGAATPNTNPCVLFTRHDVDHYAGWTEGLTPFTREMTGVNFVIQDNDLATVDNFNVVAYIGDPLMPKFPDVVNPVGTAGPFILPAGSGGSAFNASVNFATPISVASTEDVYVALELLGPWVISGGQVTDGLSVWECNAQSPAAPQAGQDWDEPGAGISTLQPDNTYGGYFCASPLAGPAYPVQTQFKIQPIVPISGGVATAVTNQVNHAASTTGAAAGFTVQDPGAGTSSMFAGLYPDAANPSFNPGRVDDIGQMFENAALPAGSLVFFMIDFGPFGPEIPAASFVPGSTGVSCLNLASMQSLGFEIVSATGRAHHVANFPAAARPLLSGIDWTQQAIGFDIATNTLHGTACTRQRT